VSPTRPTCRTAGRHPEPAFNIGVRWEQYENKNINDETFIKINDQYAPRLARSGTERRRQVQAVRLLRPLPPADRVDTNIRMAGTELYTRTWLTVEGFNPTAPTSVWAPPAPADGRLLRRLGTGRA